MKLQIPTHIVKSIENQFKNVTINSELEFRFGIRKNSFVPKLFPNHFNLLKNKLGKYKYIEKEVVIASDNRLPQIILNTNGESIPDEPKIDATMVIEKQGVVVYEGNIAIEIRGQSSQMFPKKQYGFEIKRIKFK